MKRILFIAYALFSGSTFAQLYTPNSTVSSTTNPSTGNVGVGTSNPKVKFQVDGLGGTVNRVRINSPYVGAEGSFDITMGTSEDDLGAGLRAYVPVGQPGVDRIFLGFYTTTYNSGLESRFERLTITDRGNVGIGILNPAARLEVNGQIRITSGNGNYLKVGAYNTSTDNFAYISSAGQTIGTGLKFETAGSGTTDGSTRMIILNDGNVGIGTSSPDTKLTVKGTIHSEEVKVDLNVPGPDYVFDDTYQLPPLSQVGLYINQHKHLPEVPSAEEMEQNGVHLGEMNMLLLKKVEELTLYVIELKKENEEQLKMNLEQDNQIRELSGKLKNSISSKE